MNTLESGLQETIDILVDEVEELKSRNSSLHSTIRRMRRELNDKKIHADMLFQELSKQE